MAARRFELVDRGDRQIGLSVRTAATHLYRGTHKLGVSDRREL